MQTQKLLRDDSGALARPGNPWDGAASSPPLLEVLWFRRWTIAACLLACALSASLYLLVATPIYIASARVYVQQSAPRVFNEVTGGGQSETFLQTQADLFMSAPVLARALDAVQYRSLKMGASVNGDPVTWLKSAGGLRIEPGKKSDTLTVSVESAYPEDAAAIVNAVLDAYVAQQTDLRRSTGGAMVKALQHEKDDIVRRRDADLRAMLKYKQDNGVMSFLPDKGNIPLERVSSLSSSLTASEINTIGLRAQLDGTKAAMSDPAMLAAFVEGLQTRNRDAGDREYDDVRNQLTQHRVMLASTLAVQGAQNPRVQVLQSGIAALRERLAEQQKEIAEAQLVVESSQLVAAEETEKQLRAALQAQAEHTLAMTPEAAECAKLDADVAGMQKQAELLDSRIAEVSVNSVGTAPMNVQVLERAHAELKPIKPNKTMVLVGALMAGCILGAGAAMFREWHDGRLRGPHEVLSRLGTPVIATVPRMSDGLSPILRGQVVRLDPRSSIAEAYRSVRTALHLGRASSAKTILVASASAGDGKSTTASNLAIAFADAGERTLLIDCDLREPVQHLIFEADGDVGLSNVMNDEAKLRDAVSPTRVDGLYLLPCGPVPTSPSELLASKRFARLMDALGETFDRIIIDSPPLLSVTDGVILASSADVTLLVLRMNRSTRDVAMLALDGLERVGARVLGAVANGVPSSRSYRYYGGSWQYGIRADHLLESAAAASTDGASTNGGATNGHSESAKSRNGAPRNGAQRNGDARKGESKNGEPRSADRNGDKTLGRLSAETLTINEPDWASDVP